MVVIAEPVGDGLQSFRKFFQQSFAPAAESRFLIFGIAASVVLILARSRGPPRAERQARNGTLDIRTGLEQRAQILTDVRIVVKKLDNIQTLVDFFNIQQRIGNSVGKQARTGTGYRTVDNRKQ